MKIAIINKSDSTGGAAIVTLRLLEALRALGHDARMLVAERLSGNPFVEEIADQGKIRTRFLADRLPVALHNRFSRKTLFKIDGAFAGLPVASHPFVREADAIFINWINQGVMSLNEIGRLLRQGKRIIWTMHDMWNFTGICHHAGDCRHFLTPGKCGDCPLLAPHSSPRDLSRRVFLRKERLYAEGRISFVAVSGWLAENARRSTLLGDCDVSVIPNPFPLPEPKSIRRREEPGKIRLIFAAARLDDDIKDFPTLTASLGKLVSLRPDIASRLTLRLIGDIKDRTLLNALPVPFEWHGVIRDPREMQRAYLSSDIVVSTSTHETLPGTLIEGQAFGCIPVAFDRGGQRDIINPGLTGELAPWSPHRNERNESMAEAIIRAACHLDSSDEAEALRHRMYENVRHKFSSTTVAEAYISLANPNSGE